MHAGYEGKKIVVKNKGPGGRSECMAAIGGDTEVLVSCGAERLAISSGHDLLMLVLPFVFNVPSCENKGSKTLSSHSTMFLIVPSTAVWCIQARCCR